MEDSVVTIQSFGSNSDHKELFPEWDDIHPILPIRQGDICISLGVPVDRWHNLLVVLTADCDLAREKHGGALSCIPVLSQEHYLISFRYDKVRAPLQEKLAEKLLEIYGLNLPSGRAPAQISASRMREWVTEREPAYIAETLGITAPGLAEFDLVVKALRELSDCVPNSIDAAIEVIAIAKHVLGEGKTFEKARSAVASDFASSLLKLPGDAIYLNELSSDHSGGFVAYLRRVVEINDEFVVRSQARIPHNAQYLRIGKLRSPYVYALSQQFAAVFSAIGLPSQYEDARARNLDRLKTVGQ